ncbi:hypothetical protein Tdes44962_MAKER07224 [Teratosphaeria destructans]|uniref:Uncharacterized protein n=1 Tax=Teratosphaeria destructans TaxID=418781 RepID=A0A9W7SZS3_9PEZI|nr:hypothetical protein Tdes44962_MAKER07224 [Teratosphaeria destructans]
MSIIRTILLVAIAIAVYIICLTLYLKLQRAHRPPVLQPYPDPPPDYEELYGFNAAVLQCLEEGRERDRARMHDSSEGYFQFSKFVAALSRS